MKIALLHYAAPPVVGGVESVIGHHARLMAEDGQQVSILAGRGSQTDQRVPFINIPLADSRHPQILAVKEKLDAGEVPDGFQSLLDELVRSLEEPLGGVDFLIAHNVCSLNKNLPLTAALKTFSARGGAPCLVLWHHDLAWIAPRYRAELHDGYPWDLLKSDWPGALQVTISEPRRQELAELIGIPSERIHVVPNGVDPAQFYKLEEQTRFFVSDLGLLNFDPLLLMPVRVTSRKNIELALWVLSELRPVFPQAGLVVTGPLGPHNPANLEYFSMLTALRKKLGLEGSAVFLAEHSQEYLSDSVIADFYRLADLLLLTSREEGFGIPVLEAGLAGLPVFCSDIPSLRELGGALASYFSPDASPGLVAGLIAQRLGENTAYALRRKVKQEFSWQRIYTDRIKPLLGE